MNNHQFLQAAILLAARQRKPIADSPDRDDALRQYWADSQCRLQRWQETIHQFELEIRDTAADLSVVRGLQHLATIEELIFSDVLTTVITVQIDASEHPVPEQNPMAHSVLHATRQARARTIALLDAAAKKNSRLRKPEKRILDICRGRQRAELWTDILLGYEPPADCERITPLVFNAARCKKFRENVVSLNRQGQLDSFTQRLADDVAAYFRQHPPQSSGNEPLNQKIFDSVQVALDQRFEMLQHQVAPVARPTLSGRGQRPAQRVSNNGQPHSGI